MPDSPESRWDAIVVGGGPAGSTAAHLLARAGRRVLVLEKEAFPRFRIGESLLPFSTPIFQKLGVLDEIKERFQHKLGAYFTEEGKEADRKVVFADGFKRGYGLAFQVKRAELDEILLEAAARAGAEVRFGWRVTAFRREGAAVAGVDALDPDGTARALSAKIVVDATGRAAMGARSEGGIVPEHELRRGALFTHFANVPRGENETPGDIRMVVFDRGWWWFIPFRDGTWSVGVVSDTIPSGATLEERFDRLVESNETVRNRLRDATRLIPVVSESDYSYRVRNLVGDGYVAIGDAAGFLDPIFSSGVFLAMATGEKAAETIDRVLDRREIVRSSDLRRYERFARSGFQRFRKYVVGFYEPAFREIFYSKPPVRALYSSVTSILAGGVFARSGLLRFWSNLFLFFAEREIRKARKAQPEAGA
ncbi:MAG TPA: NAD(P)/FAD-dependent oxidoreductase [Thermoanaerobaculia bacterium]|nr:NAD(P)/FAD-dependent oxidoreductase [Thermoanaerobaculia bacterium]